MMTPAAAIREVGSPALWTGFLAGVLLLLGIDLRVASRRQTAARFREAVGWSLFWVLLSLAFGAFLWLRYGGEPGLQFFAGYVLEKSLSVDNLFVFILIFHALKLPPLQQHRVLFWGVLGALLLRGSLILAGVTLVHHSRWILVVFGAFILMAAARMARGHSEPAQAPTCSAPVRWLRRLVRVSDDPLDDRFLYRDAGRWVATPLLVALVTAETADLLFALDSIPAVFAVTDDRFLVFSSNICALLGLRALYFVVRGALGRIRYLEKGLVAILAFIGLKMLLDPWLGAKIPTGTSLAIIGSILALAVVVSLLRGNHASEAAHSSPPAS